MTLSKVSIMALNAFAKCRSAKCYWCWVSQLRPLCWVSLCWMSMCWKSSCLTNRCKKQFRLLSKEEVYFVTLLAYRNFWRKFNLRKIVKHFAGVKPLRMMTLSIMTFSITIWKNYTHIRKDCFQVKSNLLTVDNLVFHF